ncbi:hypothetical protein [Streptomyces sp. NPDC048196]|uniref:Vgb family protein n=1 Tax=Streptomyces sp. NPDC048196 TaxID=3154712 RepID=UPI0033E06C24
MQSMQIPRTVEDDHGVVDGRKSRFGRSGPGADPRRAWSGSLAHGSHCSTGGQRARVPDAPPWLGSTRELVIGPDGNLWVSQQLENRFLRVTTTGRVVAITAFPSNSGPRGIDRDWRGHVWVTEEFTNALVELDRTGKRIARYPLPYPGAGPHGLRIGRDWHTVWWTGKENGTIGGFDSRTHTWTVHPLVPDSQPIYLARGPRCAMFFTELTGSRVGRIDTNGRLREYPTPTPDSRPIAIAAGRHDHMWFTEEAGAAYAELDPLIGQPTESVDGRVAINHPVRRPGPAGRHNAAATAFPSARHDRAAQGRSSPSLPPPSLLPFLPPSPSPWVADGLTGRAVCGENMRLGVACGDGSSVSTAIRNQEARSHSRL